MNLGGKTHQAVCVEVLLDRHGGVGGDHCEVGDYMTMCRSVVISSPRGTIRTSLEVVGDIAQSLEKDGLVDGVGQPRVDEGLCGQAGIDTDAAAGGDTLGAAVVSVMVDDGAPRRDATRTGRW